MGFNKLHEFHEKLLHALHPHVHLKDRKSLIFPPVEQKCNIRNSGIYAIAYAVCLVKVLPPEHVRFDESKMLHLINMFETKTIEEFPFEFIEINSRYPLHMTDFVTMRKNHEEELLLAAVQLKETNKRKFSPQSIEKGKSDKSLSIARKVVISNNKGSRLRQKQIIDSGERLNDIHIHEFGDILRM